MSPPMHETEAAKHARLVLRLNRIEQENSFLHTKSEKANIHDSFDDSGSRTRSAAHHSKIDWNVAKRFLKIVYMDGDIKRTNLAMRVGINYTACTKYVAWMTEINWIGLSQDNRVRLTEPGLQLCRHLFLED